MIVVKTSNLNVLELQDEKLGSYLASNDKDMINLFLLAQSKIRFGSGEDGVKGENVSGEFQVISDSGSADTEITLAHGLDAIPIGYLVIKIDKNGVVYDSGTTWTASEIFLKCSVANAAVTLFLLK